MERGGRIWGSVIAALVMAGGTGAYAQAGDALDEAGLVKVLTDMGFTPKKLSKGYLLEIKRDTWTYYVQFVLSPDGSKLGMNSNLGLLTNEAAITATQWRDLLAANEDVDPSCFYYSASMKKLFLHRALDNRGLTAAFLREQLDRFISNVRNTDKLWSPLTH